MSSATSPGRRTRRAAGALLAALLATSWPVGAQVEESALKAAFVYNIIAFASWESVQRRDVVMVCTAVDPGFTRALTNLEGKPVGDRRLALRQTPDSSAGCDVLVRAVAVPAASAVRGQLVVCDGCTLPDAVTAVALVREGTRVRFEVDVRVGNQVGVTFSSRLLRLARRVL